MVSFNISNGKNNNQRGQALLETIITIIPVMCAIILFLILVYKSSFIIWIQYHLNEAIYCEETKLIQSRNYTSGIGRKNHRCLNKAKKAISSYWIDAKDIVYKNSKPLEYGVKIKWDQNHYTILKAQKK